MAKLDNGQIIAENQFDHLLVNTRMDKVPQTFKTFNDYENYMISGLPEIYKDNLFFKRLPISFELYSDKPQLQTNEMVFHLSNINNKGKKYKYLYQLTRPIDLVQLTLPSNITVLLATAIKDKNNDLINILSHQSGCATSISGFLCEMGFSGFVSKCETIEIYICSPLKFLKPVSSY